MIVLSPQAAVRAQARAALQHNYARGIAAMVTALLPAFLIDAAMMLLVCCYRLFGSEAFHGHFNTQILFYLTAYPVLITAGVLVSPFFNGYVRVYYRNAFTGEMDLRDLYYYFEEGRYSRTLRLNLSFLLRMLLPGILFFLPVAAYEAISLSLDNDFYGSVIYSDFFFILSVLSIILLTLYSLKYFTVFTLSVEDETRGIKELFRQSKRIMRNHTTDAAKLIFSYTPWMLLCITVLPLLYVVPYMTQGLCIGAKWMTRAVEE